MIWLTVFEAHAADASALTERSARSIDDRHSRLRVFVLILFLSGECGVDAETSLTTALADHMGVCQDCERSTIWSGPRAHPRWRTPATSSAAPATSAPIPRTGDSGTVFCRSAVACRGPISITVSR